MKVGDEVYESDPFGIGSSREEILRSLLFLDCLKEAGVDNWEGYDIAWELFDNKV